jgi:hypothetical protein
MRPEYVLILGCLGLSMIVAYAWWVTVSSTLLQSDLMKIRNELDAKMKARGMAEDPSYLSFRKFVNLSIHLSPYLSPAILVVAYKMRRARLKSAPSKPTTTSKPFEPDAITSGPPDVVEAKIRVIVRLILHLVLGSASGMVLLIAAGGIQALATKFFKWSREPRSFDEMASLLTPTLTHH